MTRSASSAATSSGPFSERSRRATSDWRAKRRDCARRLTSDANDEICERTRPTNHARNESLAIFWNLLRGQRAPRAGGHALLVQAQELCRLEPHDRVGREEDGVGDLAAELRRGRKLLGAADARKGALVDVARRLQLLERLEHAHDWGSASARARRARHARRTLAAHAEAALQAVKARGELGLAIAGERPREGARDVLDETVELGVV